MIKEQAIEVLETEAAGILEIAGKLDDSFTRVVDLILASRGRVIVSQRLWCGGQKESDRANNPRAISA